jgi:exodeoxyribonuclease V beta subunit
MAHYCYSYSEIAGRGMASLTKKKVAISLDPITFPLHGARLIEASAGTGKTFTIAGLYLRLLLGHGDAESGHCQPLTVEQILVVTFTEAATAELRSRIRARIHQARLAFTRGESADPLLSLLLAQIDDHRAASKRLLNAERQMDEAAVYTIHGFCQRMLTQNAFESGSRFNNEFITDESRLKAQVVNDYWRRQFYSLPLPLVQEVRQLWATPSQLLSKISRYLSGHPLTFSVPAMSDGLASLYRDNMASIDTLKSSWLASCDEFPAIFKQSAINARSYSSKSLPAWLNEVSEWAKLPTTGIQYPDKLFRFSQSELHDKTKAGGQPPEHPVFADVERFLAHPPSMEAPLLAHAIEHCRAALAQAKQQKQWLSFDDLLSQLSDALDLDSSGLLSQRIRQLYPVAMIDEFQDTDPQQYHIFSSIYLNQADCGLFMIGDPKQAIYGFRGADIFTYIQARNQVAAHYTLDTNWRSSQAMVASVNQIFNRAKAPFIYDNAIPFYPVNPSPGAESKRWLLDDVVQPAIGYWLDPSDTPVTKSVYQKRMTEATVSQIQTILTGAQSGTARLQSANLNRLIEPGDMAVLVRTGSEGKMIKEALAAQGIASVYLSNRDTVFNSAVAQDVERLLQAVLMPDNDRLLRSSLASPLFDLTVEQLDALNNDENVWENCVAEFRHYRQLWQARGVLPMLRSVLSQRSIAQRWLCDLTGERQLTDFMHLGEQLQQASIEIESDHGLVRWLSQMIYDTQLGLAGGKDEQIQRLESERNLVQIVTVHKSKGLEYELVFLPFALSYRENKEGKYYDEETQRMMLDITLSEKALLQERKEQLAEDLRLIYVALTRSVYGCFIGISPVQLGRSSKEPTGVHMSALGYLLQQGEAGSVAHLASALNELASHNHGVVVTDPPVSHEHVFQSDVENLTELKAQVLTHPVDRSWWITSYSHLVKQSSQSHSFDASGEIGGFDIESAEEHDSGVDAGVEPTIFTFPRGAHPGTFLHSLFEEIEFTQPIESEETQQIMVELMEREQIDPIWLPVLNDLLVQVLSTPLDGDSLTLSHLPAEQRMVELEFLLPIQVLDSLTLNRITHRYDSLSAQAGDLGFSRVRGMLKGFIDLIFEYQGRFYILDWKSNHLGDKPSDYHPQQLKRAMVEHRYDLQYQIYALALHRFLRGRIANYDYERHFGGVYYLFLRGMDGKTANGVLATRPERAMIDALDQLIDGKPIHLSNPKASQLELDL